MTRQSTMFRSGVVKGILGAALLVLLAGPALAGSVATETRVVKQTFPAGSELRLANLAGAVTIGPGKGSEVTVEATVHARGEDAAETQKLLAGMKWIESQDRKGRREWALSYPVDDFDAFAYPQLGSGDWDWGWGGNSQTTAHYLGRKVKVVSSGRRAPILYADLRIEIPGAANFTLRNGAGAVSAGRLSGVLGIDTGSGDVDVQALDGRLLVDTGSGNVEIGEVSKEFLVDTGSGDVRIRQSGGSGNVDTGSGNVEVGTFDGATLRIDTGSGDVRVGGGQAASLDIDTGSGDIRIEGLEMETFRADTGSGDVVVRSSLVKARDILVDTGSGSVRFLAGTAASFDIEAEQGSGELVVDYADAKYKVRRGREIYGATRGDARTKIRVETGSGDCVIQPEAR
jgi:DUF4097 and DUF4098 domain-containing protein YvlB